MEAFGINISPFFQWLLKTTIQGSMLIFLILLIKLLLKRRLLIRWHYYLWLLLLVRLALPWSPQSRISIFNLIPQSGSQQTTKTVMISEDNVTFPVEGTSYTEQPESSAIQTTDMDTEQAGLQVTSEQAPQPLIGESDNQSSGPTELNQVIASDFEDILPLFWFIGAFVLAGYISLRNIILWRAIKRERQVTDQEILELLEDCKMQMRIQTVVGVVVTDKVNSPALFGFVRPRLLLPLGLLEELKLDDLQYIFLHELAHLRRRDIYLGWVVSLLQVLHWFNPLIWFAFRRMRTDQELACDALALSNMSSEEPPKYGRTLVNLFDRFSQVTYVPSIAGILEDKSQLERRIKMITRFKKNSYQWSPLAVFLIIILGCVSLPDAISINTSQSSAKESAPPISIRRVWAGPDVDIEGAPSPDGRYISYVDWDTGGDLAVYEIATGEKRRLTNKGSWDESNEFALMSRWSPDGKQIVYDWKNRNDFCELRIIGLDGSKPRILYSNKEVKWTYTYDWSPDGKQILAYFDRKNGNDMISQIVLISVDDGSERILKTSTITKTGQAWPENMCFSTDGQYIIYDFPQKEGSSERDIFMMSTDGTIEISLIEHPAHDELFGCSPDGKNILFASDRNGIYSLWKIKIAEGKTQGNPELVKSDMGTIEPLGFMREGSYYYGYSEKNNNIYNAELDLETGEILTPPKRTITRFEGYNQTPSYSPDGKYLAYISRRLPLTIFPDYTIAKIGGNVLCIKSLETGDEREIFPKIDRFRSPRWSSDGRSVFVIDMNNSGSKQIDIQTGNVTHVLHDDNIGPQPTERSHDGKTIFYVHRDKKTKINQILVRNLESGAEKEIYRSDGGLQIRLSPDDQWLAIQDSYMENFLGSSDKIPSLSIIPTAGGEPQELCKFEDGIDIGAGAPFTWTPDGKYILFAMKSQKKDIEKWDLYRISAEGGEPEKLGMEMSGLLMNLSVHPDERHIAFSITEQSNAEIWVMENFLPEEPVAKPEPTPTLRQIEVKGRGTRHSSPSLDGRYFSDVDQDTGNLIIRDIVTGKQWNLTNKDTSSGDFADWSSISPDSTKVIYYWYNNEKEDFDLRVAGLDGSGDRLLWGAREGARSFNMDTWSPDSKYVYGEFLEEKPTSLVRVSVADGSREVIKAFEDKRFFTVSCSPDGRYIAYDCAENESSSKDIFIYDLREKTDYPLIRHEANDKLLGWTPDGQYIFFSSNRNGTWDGWLLGVANGQPNGLPEMIKAGMGNVSPVGFTRNGSFYYTFEHEAWNVYTAMLNMDTGEAQSAPSPVRGIGSDGSPDWSPDGKYLAYCSQLNKNKAQIIRIRTTAADQEHELKTDLPYFDFLRWSPDSQHLLITNFDTQSAVYMINIQTGEYTSLVNSDREKIRQAELSPDGKTLFYRIRGSGTENWLISRDLETGSEKELLRTEGTSMLSPFMNGWALSKDGKHIAFTIREGTSRNFVLKIMSIEDGQTKTIVGNSMVTEVDWINDDQDLLFVNINELCRVSVEGGTPVKLLEWKGIIQSPGLHPDGQHLVFFSGGNVSEMWVMENFLPEETVVSQK